MTLSFTKNPSNTSATETTSIEKRAIVLLSGGLDSTTVLAIAADQGYSLYALSFDYGQRNRYELERASVIAKSYKVTEHRSIVIDLRAFGGSSLTTNSPVERRAESEIGKGIPSTYVPARNTLFLSYAIAWAEVLLVSDIFIGVNSVDTSGYPDCRPEFISAFEQMANLATKMGTELRAPIRIHAPLSSMDKAAIIKTGASLGVDYSLTNTCYDPSPEGLACGTCDACVLRKRGFLNAGMSDPIRYQSEKTR